MKISAIEKIFSRKSTGKSTEFEDFWRDSYGQTYVWNTSTSISRSNKRRWSDSRAGFRTVSVLIYLIITLSSYYRTIQLFKNLIKVEYFDKENTTLKEIMRPGVPLVLNFGSCSWPPFRRALKEFGELKKRFKNVDFCIIYIQEAHPTDEWSFDGLEDHPDVKQPKTMEDRLDCAQILTKMINYDVDIYVDGLDNKANKAFGAMPERLAVVKDNKVEYIGGTGPFNYSIPELETFLKKQNY